MGPKKAAVEAIAVRPGALKGKKMIITGEIEGQTRKSAEQILVNAGATIEKSLNKNVQLVVLGEKAGPKKLEKIEELSLETTEWDDLIADIKGEGGDAENDDEDDDMDDEEEEIEEEPKPKAKAPKTKAKANTKAKAEPVPKATASSSSNDFLSGKKVIVTGTVPGYDRRRAQDVLEEAGANYQASLNKKVELVILGTNAGPDKLAKIEDLGIETMPWKDVADRLGLEPVVEKPAANVEVGNAPDSVDGLTVIISGTIEGQTRSSAQKALEGVGASFAKSLNKNVELVVLGTNPGPDKLRKIEELGIPTCTFDALVESLGLELDAEPPKKKARKV